jgi:hypothetical protein
MTDAVDSGMLGMQTHGCLFAKHPHLLVKQSFANPPEAYMSTDYAVHEEEEPEEQRPSVRRADRAAVHRALSQAQEELSGIHEQAFYHLSEKIRPVAEAVVNEVERRVLGASDDVATEALRFLGVPTADIEENVDQLRTEIESDRNGGRLLCQRLGEDSFVPISTAQGVLDRRFTSDPHSERVHLVPTERAVGGFCSELKKFLVHRLAGKSYFPFFNKSSGILASPPLMLPIKVFSPTAGGRVSYSPAYFISYIAFAAPTSPAVGSILPGRYIFMLGTRQGKLFDKGVFDIPPTFDVNLVV